MSSTGSDQELARDERRRQDGQLRLIADALPALIAYLDRDYRFRFVNAAGQRWFGLSRAQVRGLHAGDALGEAWAAFRGRVESALAGREVTFEVELPMPNGGARPVEATLVPQRVAPSSRVGGVYVLATDVGERRCADRALRRAFDEIAELKDRLEAENVLLREEVRRSHGFDEIVGDSAALKHVLRRVEQVAPALSTVLILGETGTGKELIARAIHRHSTRRERPMVNVSCAALPSSLIESELFGHEQGAFTGASNRKIGRFEVADGGTLFLDEIGDLVPELQAKLLRVLQEGEFERVGSSRTRRVDVRMIAATNRDLPAAIEDGSFRSDLYYRLNVFPIELPPLRARRDDIPLLVWHFVNRTGARLGRSIDRIPQPAMERLVRYDWPGNVRELENAVERALVLSRGRSLTLDSASAEPSPVPGPFAGMARSDRIEDVERAHVLRVLESCRWKIKGRGNAAQRLGLNPSTLRFRMRRLGIARPSRP